MDMKIRACMEVHVHFKRAAKEPMFLCVDSQSAGSFFGSIFTEQRLFFSAVLRRSASTHGCFKRCVCMPEEHLI